MLKNNLIELGLSEKEASVYLASLELGASSVQKISQQAKINRATTYVIIESLSKKGLMSTMEKAGKIFFLVEDPVNLGRLLQKQKNEIEEKEKVLSNVKQELNMLFKTTGDRPVVRFFEGLEGAKTVQNEFFKIKSKKVVGTVILDEVYNASPKHDEEITKKRIKKGINSRVIYTHSKGEIKDATSKNKLREARFVPYNLFGDTATNVTIYDDIVAITTYKDHPGGVLIEDKNIAEFMRKFFDLAWDGSKKFKK